MTSDPINSAEQALLRMINAAREARRTLEELIDDSGFSPEEESMEAIAAGKADEEACQAWLDANAAKCPCCKQAYAFQRQPKRPSHCLWCGYDHDTGAVSQLVPA